MSNAQWNITYQVTGSIDPAKIDIQKIARLGGYRDGGGWRGGVYLSSADLAKPKAAVKRACDTLKDRLAKAGVPKSKISILSCRCVG